MSIIHLCFAIYALFLKRPLWYARMDPLCNPENRRMAAGPNPGAPATVLENAVWNIPLQAAAVEVAKEP